MVHVAQFFEAVIRNRDNGFVGLDGAEGIVLSWNIKIGKDIVGGGFTDIGKSNNTHS